MNSKLLVYLAAKSIGLFAFCRLLTRSRIRILGYHGSCVGDESAYNPYLFLSPETFRRRIQWLLDKGFTVIPLERAVGALDGGVGVGKLPTVITFDDGWRSTAKQLIPVLAEHGLASTLYLSTNDFQKSWPVLAVTINYMVWKSPRRRVEFEGLGEPIDGDYSLDEVSDRGLFVANAQQWLGEHPATRASVVERIHRLAEQMGLDEADLALETRRFDYMSREELLAVAKLGCAVELHGHEHRYPKGDPEAFAADLVACREAITALALPEPRHYCYPSGNFDTAAGKTLEELGIRSATTCVPGLVSVASGGAQRYALPRFLDSERMSMLVFEAELSGFAGLLRFVVGR